MQKLTIHLIIQRVNAAIDRAENIKAPFSYYILTFAFAITLRNFLEPLSTHEEISLLSVVHFDLFYTALALLLILLFHLATKTAVAKVAKVILPGFLILVIAPPLDLLISGGKGFSMTYLVPEVHDDLLWRFLTFFGDLKQMGAATLPMGVTPGIRIEVAVVLLGSFCYFFGKTSKLIKSIGYTFLTYGIIFAFSLPLFLLKAMVESLGLGWKYSDELLINFFSVVIFLFGGVTAYVGDKQHFIRVVKDIRLLRVVYYLSMFVLGVTIGTSNASFELSATNIFHFLFIPISIIFACLFSIVTNNIADSEIDKISNPDRPLVNASFSFDTYRKLAWSFLCLAMLYAALANFATLFFIVLFIGNYFLYSMPPLRLKSIPFFSKLAISLNSLALVMLGFLTITHSLLNFPGITFAIFLVGVTAAANMIDIKDYDGDKQAGINTLPVVLGPARAKRVIGTFFLFTFGALCFVVTFLNAPLYWLFVFPFLGIIQFLLINRKNYDERPVLLVTLFTVWLITYMITQCRAT